LALIGTCTAPGCRTLCLGRLCIEHLPAGAELVFVRGRPWPPRDSSPALPTIRWPAAACGPAEIGGRAVGRTRAPLVATPTE